MPLPNFIPSGSLALPDFPVFFEKSSFKMAHSQPKHVSFGQILIDPQSENLDKLSKERLQYYCNALKLKVSGDKKELTQTLEPLAKCKKFFTKKVAEINEDCKFCTALDPNLIPPLSAKWKVICKNKDVAIPIVTEITIKDYQIFTFLTNS